MLYKLNNGKWYSAYTGWTSLGKIKGKGEAIDVLSEEDFGQLEKSKGNGVKYGKKKLRLRFGF
jgi:hypothetical protein